jgi:orotate phosphoribosyltransferase|tara:strand:+ start:278 stop:547 length:270 start_codon:yes stop_codon:yes gene_type:complete
MVLILDDLITQAHSKFEAIYEAQKAGLIAADVIVLVDREQGGVAGVEEEFSGTSVHIAFKITDLFALYFEIGRMSQQVYDECVEYVQSN